MKTGVPEIRWREDGQSAEVAEPGGRLWSGEVLLNSGEGVAGPFSAEPSAAESWAVSTALAMPPKDVYGAQLVAYLCAERWVAGLLAEGDAEFRRLNRFQVSPVRIVSVATLPLPGSPAPED